MTERMRRVNEAVREVVAEAVGNLKDPRIGLVTVTALIGQGGLGRFIVDGEQRGFFRTPIVVGTVLSVALAVGSSSPRSQAVSMSSIGGIVDTDLVRAIAQDRPHGYQVLRSGSSRRSSASSVVSRSSGPVRRPGAVAA